PGEASDKAEPHRVAAGEEDDRDRRACQLGCQRHNGASTRDDHGDLPTNQFGCLHRNFIKLILGPSVFNRYVLALDIAGLLQALTKSAPTVHAHVGDLVSRNPIAGTAVCWARAASGHIAATPPSSAAKNFRRPM